MLRSKIEGRLSVRKKYVVVSNVVHGSAVLDRKPPTVANRKFAPTIRCIDVLVFLVIGGTAGRTENPASVSHFRAHRLHERFECSHLLQNHDVGMARFLCNWPRSVAVYILKLARESATARSISDRDIPAASSDLYRVRLRFRQRLPPTP